MTATTDSAGPTELGALRYDLGPIRVLALSGECDMATSDVLRAELGSALDGQQTGLVVDLTRVGFCDAGCAGVILGAARQTRVAVAGLARPARLVFDLLDPARGLLRCDSVDAAALRLSEL